MEYNLDDIKKSLLEDIFSLTAEQLKQKYLSPNGIITLMFKNIKNVEIEKRKEYGIELNRMKKEIEERIMDKPTEIHNEEFERKIDPTAPFDINTEKQKRPRILDLKGSSHPIAQELKKMLDIFTSMGFDILKADK